MKNIILLIALSLVFTNCKKKSTEPKEDIYCCFAVKNGSKSFYRCAETQSEMQSIALEIRDKNLGSLETTRKSTCSECN